MAVLLQVGRPNSGTDISCTYPLTSFPSLGLRFLSSFKVIKVASNIHSMANSLSQARIEENVSVSNPFSIFIDTDTWFTAAHTRASSISLVQDRQDL